MEREVKVNTFLVILAVLAILFAIFALNKRQDTPFRYSSEEYKENIRVLNDTIMALKKDIARYREEIERIDLERENIKKELKTIIRHNEKVDAELANGDWDDNITFLTDFLSEKDSVGE